MQFVRLGIWVVAVIFAAAPIIVSVATSPAHIRDLMALGSYANVGRDLLFLAVAILAIGLVDALEVVASAKSPKAPGDLNYYTSVAMLFVIVPQLTLYASWSAPSANLTATDIQKLPLYVCGSVTCSFIARLALVFGAT